MTTIHRLKEEVEPITVAAAARMLGYSTEKMYSLIEMGCWPRSVVLRTGDDQRDIRIDTRALALYMDGGLSAETACKQLLACARYVEKWALAHDDAQRNYESAHTEVERKRAEVAAVQHLDTLLQWSRGQVEYVRVNMAVPTC